jgi:histidine triad (HIT) family protein
MPPGNLRAGGTVGAASSFIIPAGLRLPRPRASNQMKPIKVLGLCLTFAAGFGCGAATFIRTQARPLPPVRECESARECLTDKQVLGLVTSAGLHLTPGLLPHIVAQSRDCVGINSPRPDAPIDLVFFPRRDVLNLLDIAPDDERYVMGCFALMRQVADQRGLKDWRVITNGPELQEIAYLHFHLLQPGNVELPTAPPPAPAPSSAPHPPG